jgi:hypothetical protein
MTIPESLSYFVVASKNFSMSFISSMIELFMYGIYESSTNEKRNPRSKHRRDKERTKYKPQYRNLAQFL